MSSVYQNKIQKHSTYLQKIIEESGKSDNPNIINMINELSNSVIKDIDNLKAIIKKPGENKPKKDHLLRNKKYDNGSNANEFEENGEQINNLNNKGMKRTLSDYVKIYKPAQKVKKINDNSKEIEIYFSEKSDKELEAENGKAFQEDEYESNLNHHLKEFERNSSKAKLKTLLTTSFQVEIQSNCISKKSCSTNNIINALNPLALHSLDEKDLKSLNQNNNFTQHSLMQSTLNGNNANPSNEFMEKLFSENYNYKHESQNLKTKISQLKTDNEKLKAKLKKYIQQSEFLEKKLETYKISNGGSTNYLFSNNNNNVNSSTNSLLPKQAEFERLYYEKCEEFENFEQNFNKISDKFSDVLEKIQAYQCDLLEDNKRLKEFLIFILQCCNHKQYEHISCIISYAKENQTFLDKQIFEAPAGEGFKGFEKSYLGGAKSPNSKADFNLNTNNNNKKEVIQQQQKDYFSSEEDLTLNNKGSLENVKSAISLGVKYDDLKFSKTVSEKIGVANKNSSSGVTAAAAKSGSGFNTRNKSPAPSQNNSNNASNSVVIGAYGNSSNNVNNLYGNTNSKQQQVLLKDNKSKEFSYTELMKINRQKSINKDSPPNSITSDNNIIAYSKLNANSQINASNNNTSLNITRDSKISYTNSPFRIRQESIAMDKDNFNFNLNNSYLNRSKSPFSVSSRTYNYVEVANQIGENNNGNNINSFNKNFGNNNNNHNGNTTIDLNFNISSHMKHNDSIISDPFSHDVSQSNLRDLVSLTNSTNLNNGISNIKRIDSSKNSYAKGSMINTSSNKFYIGKNKNETLYSELMMKKDQSPMSTLRSSNPSNANFTNTSRTPFYNNNILKK